MSGTSHVPPPDDYRADESGFPDAMASARYIEYILEKEGDISAVIAEPVRWYATTCRYVLISAAFFQT